MKILLKTYIYMQNLDRGHIYVEREGERERINKRCSREREREREMEGPS